MTGARIVYIVGGGVHFRQSLARMLRTAGYRTHAFAVAADMIDATAYVEPGCVLVDAGLPDASGLDLLRELGEVRPEMPVIMMDEDGSIAAAVHAIRMGAVDFITRPFEEEAMLAMLEQAFVHMPDRVRHELQVRDAIRRGESLSLRERDVLDGMLRGQSSREIAGRMGISLRTVEMHRANVMHKLDARSLPALLRLCVLAGLASLDIDDAAA